MCNDACISFASRVLTPDVVSNAMVLEVGSYDTTGTVRPVVERLGPRRYLGVDIIPGPRVDAICNVHDLEERFGPEAFDIVIATELLEHVRDWRHAVQQMLTVLRRGGLLLITTRSVGFPFHHGPFDFWRFEEADMEAVFAGTEILALERDPIAPGVFVLVRSQGAVPEVPAISLYSMVLDRRALAVSDRQVLRCRLSSPRRAVSLVPGRVRQILRRAAGRMRPSA